jgi:hypothetical protein
MYQHVIFVHVQVSLDLLYESNFHKMAFHDEVEIEGKVSKDRNVLDNSNNLDFEYDAESETYYWPCPCGDRFQITKVKLFNLKTRKKR